MTDGCIVNSGGGNDGRVGYRWVYESIIDAIPGVNFSRIEALLVQLLVFETGVLVMAFIHDRWESVLAGTAAVVVASAESVFLLELSRRIRVLEVPRWYGRLLLGTGIEIVLGLGAFLALVTYLFVLDPRMTDQSLLGFLLGDPLPAPAVFFTLVVLWDVCYRIGTGWWASIVGLWRTGRLSSTLDRQTADALRRIDAITIGFALVQLSLVPFVVDRPVLVVAILGHVAAVTILSGASILRLSQATRT